MIDHRFFELGKDLLSPTLTEKERMMRYSYLVGWVEALVWMGAIKEEEGEAYYTLATCLKDKGEEKRQSEVRKS